MPTILRTLRLPSYPSAPSGVRGDIYYNTTNNTVYYHDGTNWVAAAGVPGGSEGSGPNPLDAYSIEIKFAETIPALADAMSVAFTFPESIGAQTDALGIRLVFPDTVPAQSDALTGLRIAFADSNPALADNLRLAIAFAETNAALSDAVALKFVFPETVPALTDLLLRLRIGFTEGNAAPTDNATFTLRPSYADTSPALTDSLTKLGIGFAESSPAMLDKKEGLLTGDNRNFEATVGNWQPPNAGTVVLRLTTNGPYLGIGHLRLGVNSGAPPVGWSNAGGTSGHAVIPNKVYVLRFRYKPANGPYDLRADVRWYTSAGVEISVATGSTILAAAQTIGSYANEYVEDYTAPANAAFCRVEITYDSTTGGHNYYLDEIEFYPIEQDGLVGPKGVATWIQGATTAAGANWTNPTNAQGLRNGTNATLTDTATATVNGTLTLDPYPDPDSSLASWAITSVESRLYGVISNVSIATAATFVVQYSLNGTNWFDLENVTISNQDFSVNPKVEDLTAIVAGLWSNVNNLRFRITYTSTLLTQTATINIDAMELVVVALKDPL